MKDQVIMFMLSQMKINSNYLDFSCNLELTTRIILSLCVILFNAYDPHHINTKYTYRSWVVGDMILGMSSLILLACKSLTLPPYAATKIESPTRWTQP